MSHAWRPVFVVLAVVAAIVVMRVILVPSDFTAKDGDYKYQWHRLSAEQVSKDFTVKHRGRDFCGQCHPNHIEKMKDSGHQNIQCENCHVMYEPAKKSHPINLKEDFGYLLNIGIDRSRELCKRCHAELSYRPKTYTSSKGTEKFKQIDPTKHNPGIECAMCHDVHSAGFKTAAK
ncbi:cytochrome c3 family protein [Candidatus Magnetominusculus xianensis]|uniref:Cytochrome C n=1 Tax=Candidatus Magnetominusculus xianensis TaxID=1748249 RepID=A0ABR5SHV8_9BACT|nr:cytochrome c3 family protein [Candidatus Magnetominusculus xianensis]KWT91819.1 cytochrome C [Candidatus Magnetominusculus xianensis]MBF0403875.1 cytochrome c3 family protein [Nitrospirota bacterium]